MCGYEEFVCEIYCGHFPWKSKDDNLQDFAKISRRIFRQSFGITGQIFHPNFPLHASVDIATHIAMIRIAAISNGKWVVLRLFAIWASKGWPSFPLFLGVPWSIFSRAFPCSELTAFSPFFQGFCGFNRGRTSLNILMIFLVKHKYH